MKILFLFLYFLLSVWNGFVLVRVPTAILVHEVECEGRLPIKDDETER